MIKSEFSLIQLLVDQKRASLYQDLPWLQRRLVVTIRVNTVTSLSHYHVCCLSSHVEPSAFSRISNHWMMSLLPHLHLHLTTLHTPSLHPPPCVLPFPAQHTHLNPAHSQPEQSGWLSMSFMSLCHFHSLSTVLHSFH